MNKKKTVQSVSVSYCARRQSFACTELQRAHKPILNIKTVTEEKNTQPICVCECFINVEDFRPTWMLRYGVFAVRFSQTYTNSESFYGLLQPVYCHLNQTKWKPATLRAPGHHHITDVTEKVTLALTQPRLLTNISSQLVKTMTHWTYVSCSACPVKCDQLCVHITIMQRERSYSKIISRYANRLLHSLF